MKDTYVLSSTCWFTYNFYMTFIKRKKIFLNLLALILNIVIIVNIKSYLIISLIPGALLWLNSAYILKIKNQFIRLFSIPFLILIISFIGLFSFQNLSYRMGDYGDINSAINKAKIIQSDLLREEAYGKNSYNLGEIDGTISGMVQKAPLAIFTAIFRPLPWEIGSPTMIISVILPKD